MNEKDLQIGEKYYVEFHDLIMEYCGTETYQGRTYHKFWDPLFRLSHWLEPQNVSLPNTACSGLRGTHCLCRVRSQIVADFHAESCPMHPRNR